MAKRLTDTEKWKDDWYISLSNDDKVVWQWLVDNCNHAGICKKNMALLNLALLNFALLSCAFLNLLFKIGSGFFIVPLCH